MANSLWVKADDAITGPFSASQVKDQIRSGEIVASDELANSRRGPWKTAGSVPELASYFDGDSPEQRKQVTTWSLGGVALTIIAGLLIGGASGALLEATQSAGDVQNVQSEGEVVKYEIRANLFDDAVLAIAQDDFGSKDTDSAIGQLKILSDTRLNPAEHFLFALLCESVWASDPRSFCKAKYGQMRWYSIEVDSLHDKGQRAVFALLAESTRLSGVDDVEWPLRDVSIDYEAFTDHGLQRSTVDYREILEALTDYGAVIESLQRRLLSGAVSYQEAVRIQQNASLIPPTRKVL